MILLHYTHCGTATGWVGQCCSTLAVLHFFMHLLQVPVFLVIIQIFCKTLRHLLEPNRRTNVFHTLYRALFLWNYHAGMAPGRVEECCSALAFWHFICSCCWKMFFFTFNMYFCNSFCTFWCKKTSRFCLKKVH